MLSTHLLFLDEHNWFLCVYNPFCPLLWVCNLQVFSVCGSLSPFLALCVIVSRICVYLFLFFFSPFFGPWDLLFLHVGS